MLSEVHEASTLTTILTGTQNVYFFRRAEIGGLGDQWQNYFTPLIVETEKSSRKQRFQT